MLLKIHTQDQIGFSVEFYEVTYASWAEHYVNTPKHIIELAFNELHGDKQDREYNPNDFLFTPITFVFELYNGTELMSSVIFKIRDDGTITPIETLAPLSRA